MAASDAKLPSKAEKRLRSNPVSCPDLQRERSAVMAPHVHSQSVGDDLSLLQSVDQSPALGPSDQVPDAGMTGVFLDEDDDDESVKRARKCVVRASVHPPAAAVM
jgi:hypothetical protein